MSATAESVRSAGFKSSALKRPMRLRAPGARLTVDADGAVRSLASVAEKRAVFGFEQVWFSKVQAGIVVHAQKPDWDVKLAPSSVRLAGKVFDVEVSQTLEFLRGAAPGFTRTLRLRNGGQGQVRLRVAELQDPTAAHFPDDDGSWGALGVNAFNRGSHVAMDEVSDPPSARVVGSDPAPSRLYMTTSRQRAQEAISLGEVPESTAGMSGQVLIIAGHELDLAPGDSKELVFASIYDPGKLEDALADFGRLRAGKGASAAGPAVACSDPAVTEAAAWALSSVQAAQSADDLLDRHESLRSLSLFFPQAASKAVMEARSSLRKDGALPHSLDRSKPGVLETAVFLKSAALAVVLSQDKKQARAGYPYIKKCASYLMSCGVEVKTDPLLPQGWRRKLGRGYPTGEIPEVSLAVAAALEAASQAARVAGRAGEGAKYLERSKLICDRVRKTLLDERGSVSMCRDTAGRLRTDETADVALAAYRHPFMDSAEQAAAHRLMERDFDTAYGARCVPATNAVYFNATYGEGQLGGVWPRAALAHAVVCYRAGLGGAGSLAVSKAAKLVVDEQLKIGGVPGEFSLWVDPDRKEAHGGDDPVAAARFLEALIEGELGLPAGVERPSLSPAKTSTLGWLLATGFWAGEGASAFMGRTPEKTHLFCAGGKLGAKAGERFEKCETIDVHQRGVAAATFYNPGQVICVGNSLGSPVRLGVAFPPRAADFGRRLSTAVEEFDPAKGSWNKTGSLRVSTSMSVEAAIGPYGWKAFRVSTG
ncbi:MAG: hypothetical protein JRM73_00295 [Nitrososphaerota archaeon]|nr:hypothetical protein [Nitrososphaerota archaeon]